MLLCIITSGTPGVWNVCDNLSRRLKGGRRSLSAVGRSSRLSGRCGPTGIQSRLQNGGTSWYAFTSRYFLFSPVLRSLQPLNFTYGRDKLHDPVPPTLQSRDTGLGSLGRTTDSHAQPLDPNHAPRSNPATVDCNVSVFIAMPSPYKHPPELGGEIAIGTAEVLYGHSEPFHP